MADGSPKCNSSRSGADELSIPDSVILCITSAHTRETSAYTLLKCAASDVVSVHCLYRKMASSSMSTRNLWCCVASSVRALRKGAVRAASGVTHGVGANIAPSHGCNNWGATVKQQLSSRSHKAHLHSHKFIADGGQGVSVDDKISSAFIALIERWCRPAANSLHVTRRARPLEDTLVISPHGSGKR